MKNIISDEFMNDLCVTIDNACTKKISEMDEKEEQELERLLSIYQSIKNIELAEVQIKFMSQSNNAFSNVDFSNVDFNSLINKLQGK